MRLSRRFTAGEEGLSLLVAIGVLFVSSLVVAGSLVAATGDIHGTQRSIEQKSAYYAALAGVEAYQYHLNAEPNYWSTCRGISESHVEGTSGETYTVKVLPATGKTKCEAGVSSSVIQSTTAADGNTFRVESTGEVKTAAKTTETRSIVATFGNPSFLDYVYVSNYEVEDPVTYKESERPKNCEHYYAERLAKGWTTECAAISFRTGDEVKGPMHTNDAAAICGSPVFGRSTNDAIEMNGGYYTANACTNRLTMNGTYSTDGPTLLPPSSDSQLAALAGYKFAGKTTIKLISTTTPNEIEVTNASVNGGSPKKMAFPSDGVIYVENSSAGCAISYSPFATNYTSDTGCGNVYVEGSYKESLTIAASNDLIIKGNITTTTEGGTTTGKPIGNATLGLIASNFVRIYHPVEAENGEYVNEAKKCEHARNAAGSLENPTVDAAILTTAHSFIVDNYRCGAALGTLTVWGSIAQNWRGPVGTQGSPGTGYLKNYNYDERLATQQPPDFLTPSATVWRVERETVG